MGGFGRWIGGVEDDKRGEYTRFAVWALRYVVMDDWDLHVAS